jgi:hypothetical protein
MPKNIDVPNHVDDPEQFEPWCCAVCVRCWRHIESGRGPYDGPYDGYEERGP